METKELITLTLENGQDDAELFTETDLGEHLVHLINEGGDLYYWDVGEVFKIRDFFNAVCAKYEERNDAR